MSVRDTLENEPLKIWILLYPKYDPDLFTNMITSSFGQSLAT